MSEKDPRSFLPLTPLAFHALLALADGERHGYAIIREVDERTDGLIKLRTGTLYTLLQRLLDEALIEESDARPAAEEDDSRRKYYRLTSRDRDELKRMNQHWQRLHEAIGHVRKDRGR